MAVYAQLPLSSVSILSFQKIIFFKQNYVIYKKKTVACSIVDNITRGSFPLMLPGLGIFKMLLNVHFFFI